MELPIPRGNPKKHITLRIDRALWEETMRRHDYIASYWGKPPSRTAIIEEVLKVGNRMMEQTEERMRAVREESRRRGLRLLERVDDSG